MFTSLLKNTPWRLLVGLFILIVMGVIVPRMALAQTVPPPPPLEQRWDLLLQTPALKQAGHDPQPDPQPDNFYIEYRNFSKLVFQSYRDDNWEIYLGGPTGDTRVARVSGNDIQPRLNRGADQIAFASNRAGNYEIYLMNMDGSGVRRLTENEKDDVAPVWSPDGKKILFQSYRDGQSEIYVMDINGDNQTRLTQDPDFDGQPDWSPDGKKIAFASRRTGGYRIYVANADGTAVQMLSAQSYSAHPKWSPDGSMIAYDADGNQNGWQDLWLMNADGSDQHAIFTYGGTEEDYWVGGWTPDQRAVSFTQIQYTYFQNQWYWTYASIGYYEIATSGLHGNYSQTEDWYPDWRSPDHTAPTSQIVPLPAQSPGPFLLRWTSVEPGNSGIYGYDVQVKDGAGASWTPLMTLTTATSISYPGIGGHTYYFQSQGPG